MLPFSVLIFIYLFGVSDILGGIAVKPEQPFLSVFHPEPDF